MSARVEIAHVRSLAVAIGLLALPAVAIAEATYPLPPFFRYQVEMPGPPAADASMARQTKALRAASIRQFLACGQEIDFLHRFSAEEPGQRSTESFLGVVLAKLVWLQVRRDTHCQQTLRIVPEDLKAGEWTQRTPSDPELSVAQLNTAMKQAYGGRCSSDDIITGYRYVKDMTLGHKVDVFEVDFSVTRECLKQQVNQGLAYVKVHGLLGSSKLPCASAGLPAVGGFVEGEWDVAVRDLTRIFYVDREYEATHAGYGVLIPEVRRYVRDELLTASGPLGPAGYSLYSCGNQERSTGTPQELADERDFGDELLDALGDFFEFLLDLLMFLFTLGLAMGTAALGSGFVGALGGVIGALGGAAGPLAAFLSTLVTIPETENHRLMIETSRYLKNQIVIEVLGPDYDNVDLYREDQKEIKAWLMERMQSYLATDFEEYNARPYQRYSINALLNLTDFAVDPDLKKASRMVLEHANAKFAVGSSQGRRHVPFRRLLSAVRDEDLAWGLSNAPPKLMFDLHSKADHQVAQMLLFTGQTQQLPEPPPRRDGLPLPPARLASIPSAYEMIYAATSTYEPHDLIVDLAIRKTSGTYQRIRHHGFEIYSSSPAYLVSAGGVQTGPANEVVGFSNTDDRGAAVATTLMLPTRAQSVTQLIRIEGPKVDHGDKGYSFDHNLCVWKGFACGFNVRIPPEVTTNRPPPAPACVIQDPPGPFGWVFIDTACLDPAASRAFVAVYREPCLVLGDCNVGVLEVVEAGPSADFAAFRTTVKLANPAGFMSQQADGSVPGSYRTSSGDRIGFDCAAHQRDPQRWGIESVNGVRQPDLQHWPAAEGVIRTSLEPKVKVTIRNPALARELELDFTDLKQPKRTER